MYRDSGDSGALRTLAQPPDILTLSPQDDAGTSLLDGHQNRITVSADPKLTRVRYGIVSQTLQPPVPKGVWTIARYLVFAHFFLGKMRSRYRRGMESWLSVDCRARAQEH